MAVSMPAREVHDVGYSAQTVRLRLRFLDLRRAQRGRGRKRSYRRSYTSGLAAQAVLERDCDAFTRPPKFRRWGR